VGEFLTLEVKLPHLNGILEEIIPFHAGEFPALEFDNYLLECDLLYYSESSLSPYMWGNFFNLKLLVTSPWLGISRALKAIISPSGEEFFTLKFNYLI